MIRIKVGGTTRKMLRRMWQKKRSCSSMEHRRTNLHQISESTFLIHQYPSKVSVILIDSQLQDRTIEVIFTKKLSLC